MTYLANSLEMIRWSLEMMMRSSPLKKNFTILYLKKKIHDFGRRKKFTILGEEKNSRFWEKKKIHGFEKKYKKQIDLITQVI
jgi:hypothetical protein